MSAGAYPNRKVVLLDDRKGAVELDLILQQVGLTVAVQRMDSADIAFEGNGAKGRALVGIERKCLTDMLCCITSGHLSGLQFPTMSTTYDYLYLVVEGRWRENPDNGILEVPMGKASWGAKTVAGRRWMAYELEGFLTTVENKTPVRVRRTGYPIDTAHMVANLHRWFNSKTWDQHRAHQGFYNPQPGALSLFKPSLLRRMAAELPGIGWEKSAAVERKFRSVHNMVSAPISEWLTIPGIGKTIADRATKSLRGEQGEEGE